ncbi:energy-coupling factor transporter transmembrane component T family protein [Collinsella ihumii]|uniref:energy-coupling factor transporter transmembrane component T family protein n=1 Tax=Collinsella ihumii TaxID=1720204 RepID=UPI0025AA9648|nr:energy-coupling factor transporter transmembrane component T [Collinsella ihumii]MDN0056299.1 energy-coupling factor transporter transmembrane component T [Collinsella ihumii]
MNEVFSFGSYYPGDSALHRLDPRTKLLGGIVFLLIALLARSFVALGAIAVFIAALYGAARIPAGRALRSLAPLLAIVLVVAVLNLLTNHSGRVLAALGPFQISEGSLRSCAFTAARMLLMMCGMSLVTMTTMTLDLTCAVERLLAPFARIGLPAHELGMMLGIALRFMPQFATELMCTYRAQISRGAHVTAGPLGSVRMLSSISIPLFASIFRHAETLSAAMEARCYHGEAGRTRLHPLRYRACDGVAAAILAALGACVVVIGVIAG